MRFVFPCIKNNFVTLSYYANFSNTVDLYICIQQKTAWLHL